MLHSIAKWYVSRAIDCNRPLPTWVERRLAYDPILKQFYDQSLRLAERMRTTAATPESSLVRNGKVEVGTSYRDVKIGSKRTPALFATCAIGLAAVTLLALLPFFEHRNHDVKVDSTDQVEARSAMASEPAPIELNPSERKRLSELLADGKNFLQSLKQEADRGDVSGIESDLEHLTAFANLDVNQIIGPVSDFGTSYGAMLSEFDQRVDAENRQLIFGGVDAWQYFVHQLPKSAATLAGL